MRAFALLLAALAFTAAAAAPEGVTAIVGATVVHPERDNDAAVPDSTIILRGNRIEAVGRSATTPVPKGARIVDAHGRWVIPGLIDAHVHFFQSGNLYTRPDAADFNAWMPYAKEVARNRRACPSRSARGSPAASRAWWTSADPSGTSRCATPRVAPRRRRA